MKQGLQEQCATREAGAEPSDELLECCKSAGYFSLAVAKKSDVGTPHSRQVRCHLCDVCCVRSSIASGMFICCSSRPSTLLAAVQRAVQELTL